MKKIGIIVAPGFEESETLTIIDILTRSQMTCTTFGHTDQVTGAHDITLLCDEVLNDYILDYDMVVLPGGRPGADNLRDSEKVIDYLKKMNNLNKYICSICASCMVLDKAELLKDKKYTGFPGYDKICKDGEYLEDIVVQDGHLITSRAPGTTYAFASYLTDILGGDSLSVKKRMAYFDAFKEDTHE